MSGMSDQPAPEPLMKSVSVSEDEITAVLTDGRTVSVPLAWSWRLSEATPEQRANVRLIALEDRGHVHPVIGPSGYSDAPWREQPSDFVTRRTRRFEGREGGTTMRGDLRDDGTGGLTRRIIGAGIEVHRRLGPGLLEKTCEVCFAEELRHRGTAPVHVSQVLTYP
jgi:hypothetical protein